MDVKSLIGLTEQRACQTLSEAGIDYRIEIWVDGYQISGDLNTSYDQNRVNLKIENGIVFDVAMG